MIRNESDLQVVREQIQRLENTLSRIRASVGPQSSRRFALMAESYVDTLGELRSQVDAFVGTSLAFEAGAPLVMTLLGEGVQLGTVGGRIVARTYENLRTGIASIIDSFGAQTDEEEGGRHPKWIEDVADLPFRLVPGSVRIVLGDPSRTETFAPEQLQELQEAIGLIVRGVEWASGNVPVEFSPDQLPPQVRQALLTTLGRLAPARGSQIDEVAFGGRFVQSPENAKLTNASRRRIAHELKRSTSALEPEEVIGTIREVNLDRREFRLRELIEHNISVWQFDESLRTAVTAFLDTGETVRVAGRAVRTVGGDAKLHVEYLTLHPGAPPANASGS